MPVPGGAVDQDLAVFDALEGDEADDGGDQAEDAGDEMNGVGAGEDVKGVAAVAAGLEAEPLERELMPGEHCPARKSEPRSRVASSQGRARREVGLPRPNHSSMASMEWNMWRRAISTVTELSSRRAVLSHEDARDRRGQPGR